jgi:hypothetical protein
MQRVGVLYLAIKVGLLSDQQQLIKRLGHPMLPYVMAMILAEERLGEGGTAW